MIYMSKCNGAAEPSSKGTHDPRTKGGGQRVVTVWSWRFMGSVLHYALDNNPSATVAGGADVYTRWGHFKAAVIMFQLPLKR